MPTTVQSRCAKRSVSPMPGAAKPSRDRAAGDDLGRAGPEHAALDDLHLRPQREAAARSRRGSTTFDGLPVSRLGRLISTTVSFDTSRCRPAPVAISGMRLDDRRLRAVDAALHLGLRAAADHDHVVGLAGGDQRLPQPASSISTVANTNTTSAMPPAVSTVVSLRVHRLRAM